VRARRLCSRRRHVCSLRERRCVDASTCHAPAAPRPQRPARVSTVSRVVGYILISGEPLGTRSCPDASHARAHTYALSPLAAVREPRVRDHEGGLPGSFALVCAPISLFLFFSLLRRPSPPYSLRRE
jgi:hypothetical protein